MAGLTDAQAGKIAEHLKLSPDGPSYEAVSNALVVQFRAVVVCVCVCVCVCVFSTFIFSVAGALPLNTSYQDL